MLKAEGRMELAALRKHGASIRELARLTGHSWNTVRRYLRGGEMAERRKPTVKRVEKLDAFKDYIVGRMCAASPARIPAAVLFRETRRTWLSSPGEFSPDRAAENPTSRYAGGTPSAG